MRQRHLGTRAVEEVGVCEMTSLFKKKQPKHVSAAFCSVSEVEQHLAESEFNVGKIQEIQNKFAGGEVGCIN